jgi:hypothetical protein
LVSAFIREDPLSKIRYFLFVVIALAAGIAGGMVSQRFLQPSPREDGELKNIIVAHEFHLVDEEGRDRWVLNLSKDGEPTVTFVNQNGWAPMAIGINKEGLPFFNMVLEPNRKGGPSLIMMDSQMKSRALLGLSEEGEPHLSLLDETGQKRLALGSAEFTNPLTGLPEKRPCSSIVLFDEDGKVLWSAPEVKLFPVTLSSVRGETQP